MTTIVILLTGALAILGIGLAIGSKQRQGEPEQKAMPESSCQSCTQYNGSTTKCEQECLMEAATKEIEYYDDEELDCYAGRPSDNYTDSEAEEFREVLYTMRPEEAEGWNRSLILRGINIPDQVKDELILIINDVHN